MKHKYVRHSLAGFIIWPADTELYHKHIGIATRQSKYLEGEILSAGFVDIHDGRVKCYGKSESLNLGGLPDDTAEIAKQLGLETA